MSLKDRAQSSANLTAKAVGQEQPGAFDDFDDEPGAAAEPQGGDTEPAAPAPPAAGTGAAVADRGDTSKRDTPSASVDTSDDVAADPPPAVPASRQPPSAVTAEEGAEDDAEGQDGEEDDGRADHLVNPLAYEIPTRIFNALKDEADTARWKKKARSPQTEIVRLALDEAAELLPELVRSQDQQILKSPFFGTTRVVNAPKTRGATERLQVRMTYGETRALARFAEELGVDTVVVVRAALAHRYPVKKRVPKEAGSEPAGASS